MIQYHPFAEALKTIGGGNAFALMVPVLAGFIAVSIADRPGFAGMVGGYASYYRWSRILRGTSCRFISRLFSSWFEKVLAGMPSFIRRD